MRERLALLEGFKRLGEDEALPTKTLALARRMIDLHGKHVCIHTHMGPRETGPRVWMNPIR